MSAHTAISEALTQRFYHWEKRGRGWAVFPFSVDLEPDYYAFPGHKLPNLHAEDDSTHHTLVSTLLSYLKKKEPIAATDDPMEGMPPASAFPYEADHNLVAYKISLPQGQKIQVEDMQPLFLMLSYTAHPISFEIIATSEAIHFQIACRDKDKEQVCRNVQAYFPVALITRHDEGLEILADNTPTCAIDFGLTDEFMRPLATDTEQDPYIGLFAILDRLQAGERGVIQILFKGAINPWSVSIMQAVSDGKGGSFFADAPDMLPLAEEKISAPLFGVTVKIAAQASTGDNARNLTIGLSKALIRLTSSKGNRLQMLPETEYTHDQKVDDIFLRQSYRLGMLLNSNELATIAHFPTDEILSAKLARPRKKTKAAPAIAQGQGLILGKNIHNGEDRTVSVPASLRLRHTHIIGATGTGKSTLFLSMIEQDMRQGNGIAVLDPHGDLIESVLARVPKERIKDCIIVDPADAEYPIAFNILSAHSEAEKDILSSDLVAAFKRLSTSWGDQMNSVFANAILAFLESTEGGTLADLRRFLIEKPYRDNYLNTVQDEHIRYYWQHEYPLLKSSSIGSILTRLDTFLRPKLIRNMVAQKKGLDFETILDTQKILLVKLSQGLIGAENSYLLGTFFVSKIYQAAMARQAKGKADRNNFFLFVDEFQNFVCPSMSYMLSGVRKYNLGLILAHQDMQQLQKYDTELASSVVVNAGTRICFRLGDIDAKRFANGFSYFDATDIENLSVGEAIARIDQPSMDFTLTTIPLPDIEPQTAKETTDAAIEYSRSTYSTRREAVEKTLETYSPAPTIEVVNKEASVAQPAQPKPELIPPSEVSKPKILAPKPETEHRYLQMLIKRMAESRGYKAAIEETTPDGKGRVDVSLERDGKRIACEISITTDAPWEVHNIQKCLAANYSEVIVCSNDVKNLKHIQKQATSTLTADEQQKVMFVESQELSKYFDTSVMPELPAERVVKGYRVKVEYGVATPQDAMKKKEGVVRAVTNSMGKKRK